MAVRGNLYLFLHGLTVARERGPEIQIVLPSVPGHVYKAGGWLAETPIGSGKVLDLRGVDPGNASFADPAVASRLLNLPGTTVTERGRAATIFLPRPHAILPLLVARKDDPDYVARTKDFKYVFHQLATVQVLIYAYPDENEVTLGGHYWEPAAIGQAMSLHIISTSEEPEGQQHEDMTEDVMHEVLRDYPGVEYFKPRVLGPPWLDPGDLGPELQISAQPGLGQYVVRVDASTGAESFAFALAELEHPTSRTLRLSHLARLQQGHRSIDSMWQDPDFLGERTSNCVTTH